MFVALASVLEFNFSSGLGIILEAFESIGGTSFFALAGPETCQGFTMMAPIRGI